MDINVTNKTSKSLNTYIKCIVTINMRPVCRNIVTQIVTKYVRDTLIPTNL